MTVQPMFIVFDLDGTLIDSIGDLAIAINRLVRERGGRPLEQAEVARMVGEGAGLLVSRAFDAAGIADDPRSALPRFLEIYDAILPGETKPYPGVLEAIAALSRTSRLAVLTNKPTDATRKILSTFDLERAFFAVLGGDGPARRKPHPDGLQRLMSEATAEPVTTIMVGDSSVDLRTAQAAGTRACIVRYGFGYANFDHRLLRGDEVFVDHPPELLRLAGNGHER
jgi:phosphoglycolate phosphatase